MQKAYLAVVEPPKPPTSPPALGGNRITFQFNPKEYTIKKTAKWERKAGKSYQSTSLPEFTGSEPATFDLELFLDCSDSTSGTVVADVEKLFDCLVPTSSTRSSKRPSPPWVIFGWGSAVSIVAIVKSVSAKYTLFRPDGSPVRAVCSLSLEEMPAQAPRQNPTSGGLSASRTHRMVAGDTLASVAHQEYGDPRYWRAIAEVNDVDDPQRIPAGTELRLPPLDEAAAYA